MKKTMTTEELEESAMKGLQRLNSKHKWAEDAITNKWNRDRCAATIDSLGFKFAARWWRNPNYYISREEMRNGKR